MTIRQSSLERLGNFKVMIDDTTDEIVGLVDAHGQERHLVTAATGPGGGVASLTAGAYPLWLQGASLLDRVPLPRMRPIMTPRDVNLAAAVLPAGATATIETAADEMYGECIRIDLPAGLTTSTGRIVLPIREAIGGGFPRALLRSECRLKVKSYTEVSTLYVFVSETVTPTQTGYFWSLRGGSSSAYGVLGPHTARWNDVWRTYQLSRWQVTNTSGSPAAWDESTPEYECRSIRLTVATTAPTTIWINNVRSPEWDVAGIIQQGDGGYQSFMDRVVPEFLRRGWPGCISKGNSQDPATIPDGVDPVAAGRLSRDIERYGWLTLRHLSHAVAGATDADYVTNESFEDIDTTAAQMAEFQQRWLRDRIANGYPSGVGQWASCLRNEAPRALNDAASILRASGLRGCRGRMSDGEFGVHPYDTATTTTGLGTPGNPIVPGWSPRWGRYNRMYIDCAMTTANTPAARDTYGGSHWEKAILRALLSNELTWGYIHRVQDLTGTTPAADQSGTNFVRDMIAHMDELVRAGRVVMLNPAQADLLTYDRPGDVYMDWSGAWRSRTTGKVVL